MRFTPKLQTNKQTKHNYPASEFSSEITGTPSSSQTRFFI